MIELNKNYQNEQNVKLRHRKKVLIEYFDFASLFQ